MSPPPTKTPPKAPAKVPAPGIPRPAPLPRPAAPGAAAMPTPAAKPAPKPAAKPLPLGDDARATVLLVGSGDPMEAALTLALGRYGLNVEASPMKEAIQAVFVHAPDLAILLGDAAREEGGEVLAALAGRASTAIVPVALLSDDPNLEKRLRAFRFGAVAVVPRTASADEMARRIADIVKELPERDKAKGQELGETTLEELIGLVSTRLRSGILSVKAQGQSEGARIVLRGGQPVSEAIEQLVQTIRPLVTTEGGALAFEFEEKPTGRLGAISDSEIALPGDMDIRAVLSGRRFVLVERSPTRADDLVQALRGLGAHVAVVDGEGAGMEKARAIAPEVVVVDARGIGGWASPALKVIRHDLRLRWAALLVARADELWPEGAPGADLSRLAAGVKPLVETDLSLTERATREESFPARLESIGPERLLRALLASGKTLHVRVQHNRAVIDLDLAEGLVVGATAKSVSGKSVVGKPVEVSGAAALAVLLGLASGRAQVERRAAPSIANMMSPLDDAIAAADREQPPIRPSLPPPSIPPSSAPDAPKSPLTSALLSDPPELLRQLESLLIDLKKSLPAPELASTAPEARELEGGGVSEAATAPPPDRIPAPAPVPNLGARKKTLVGMIAPGFQARPEPSDSEIPVHSAELRAPTIPPKLASSAPALRAPVSVRPPPADADSLAEWLEPDSSEIAVPVSTEAAYPAAIPEGKPLPVAARGDATGPLVAPTFPSQVPPADDEPIELPKRRFPWGGLVAMVLLLAVAGVGAYAWLVLRPSGALAGLGIPGVAGPTTTTTPTTLPVSGALPPDAPAPLLDAGVSAASDASTVVLDAGTADAGLSDGGADAGELDGVLDGGLDAPEELLAVEGEGEPDAGDLFDDTTVDDATLDVTDRRARIEYLIDRANYRRRHGEPDGAARDYEAVLRMEGSNARALAGLARLNLDRGRGAAAVPYARRLVRSHSTQPANYVLLGDCLLAAGDRAGAIRAFQDALRIQPSYRTARERIAHLPPR